MKKYLIILILLGFASPAYAMRQVLFNGASTLLSGTAYNFIGGSGQNWDTNETKRQCFVTEGRTFSNLRVKVSAAPGVNNSRIYTLRYGGDTILTCTVSGATQTICDDPTNSVFVPQGGKVSIQQTTTGTPATARAQWSVMINGGDPRSSLLCGGQGPASYSGPNSNYIALHAGQGSQLTVETGSRSLMAFNGMAQNLWVDCGYPGLTETITYTVLKNAAASSLSCSVTGTSATSTCHDNINKVYFEFNDSLNLVGQMGSIFGTFPGNNCQAGVTIVASTTGAFAANFGSNTALSVAANRYMWLTSGQGTPQTAETITYTLGQPGTISRAAVIQNMIVNFDIAPDPGNSIILTLRKNAASTDTSCTIADTGTSCQWLNATTTIAENDVWDTKAEPIYYGETAPAVKATVGYMVKLVQRRIW